MSLITVVKAGNITNLSNARYCAGMGVDIIGFPVGEGSFFGQNHEKITEILGWVTGVKHALEIDQYSISDESLLHLVDTLNPDYLQVKQENYTKYKTLTNKPLIITTTNTEGNLVYNEEDIVLYQSLSDFTSIKDKIVPFCKKYPTILGGPAISQENVLSLLEDYQPYGIELKGENEISPGLKSFDEFIDILEILESND